MKHFVIDKDELQKLESEGKLRAVLAGLGFLSFLPVERYIHNKPETNKYTGKQDCRVVLAQEELEDIA
jgi:hypothetical protein